MEANSYKRSVHEEFLKNEDIKHLLNKLEREQSSLQNTLKTCLDKFNSLKDKYSKLIQMTEFQNQNLDQILFVCFFLNYNNLVITYYIKIISMYNCYNYRSKSL